MTMCNIIGRKEEVEELQRIYNSGRAEFVAVYGRRRVGKTFLIDEAFEDGFAFHHTGLSPYDRKKKTSLKDQLENFYYSLLKNGAEGIERPKTWLEAFFQLEMLLEQNDNGCRQVVFIDEMPWMDTARSGFLTAFESFWNGWANKRHSMCLIVCGSATSWMLDNIINNKGGLYGRVTYEIKLHPFTLAECEEFYNDRGISMSRYDVIQSYMILGGIPYYMNLFNPAYSMSQNIDNLLFARKAKLGDEFSRLFKSVFDKADDCIKVIRFLYTRHGGYTRGEIARQLDMQPNGDFTKVLLALEESDFIVRYSPFGSSDIQYRLVDCFCWFWLHFKEEKGITETDYWENHLNESSINSWRGIAFENVCFNHIDQIKAKLGISGVSTTESALLMNDNAGKMQMDMIISRKDHVTNVCEIKFCKDKMTLTSDYLETMEKRRSYVEGIAKGDAVHLTLISLYGLSGSGRAGKINSYVDISDLFRQI